MESRERDWEFIRQKKGDNDGGVGGGGGLGGGGGGLSGKKWHPRRKRFISFKER